MHAAMEARPLIVLSPRLDLECGREKCASTDVSRPMFSSCWRIQRGISRDVKRRTGSNREEQVSPKNSRRILVVAASSRYSRRRISGRFGIISQRRTSAAALATSAGSNWIITKAGVYATSWRSLCARVLIKTHQSPGIVPVPLMSIVERSRSEQPWIFRKKIGGDESYNGSLSHACYSERDERQGWKRRKQILIN